ncbi:Tetratricopeptide repeat [Phytophthora cactorum]|nr:Tetratricopeptide repeat [Phytophthora cactorum]
MIAPPNRSLGSRSQRSRRGFGSGKSRLSLKIDADCATNGDVISTTRQSTPASTSSSCSSDVVPWWEVEYQCPPPGHLGAHVVPVSADEQRTDLNDSNTQNIGTSRSAATSFLSSVSVDFSGPTTQTITSSSQKANAIRSGLVLYETPERARRGSHCKLPSQKRKMRPQDPADCEVDLFSTPVTKELKRFHESSPKKSALPSRVVTPATLEAVDCYTQAIALDPNDHVFYSNRSAAYLSLDDATHALEDAELCIKTKPDWPKAYSRKGAALHSLKRYDEATAAYNDGLKVDASNAACLSGIEEVKKAQAAATQAFNPLANAFGPDMFGKIATNPRLAPLLGDPEFVKVLQEIQRDPSKINEHIKDTRVMTPTPMEEDLTEEEKAERAAKKAADEAKQRGNAFYKQKKFSEAIECYNEAIEKDGTNMSYYSNLAAVKLEMAQYEACIEDCKKAIEVGRAHRADYALIAKAYVRIGNAHLKKGETEENLTAAIDAYEGAQMENRTKEVERKIKALQVKLRKAKELAYIDPEKALAAKNEGNEFFKNGEFPQAVERYTEAIKRDPSCAVYYANRAAAYTKLTSFNEAKKDCEKAIELDPKYVKAYSRMGAIQCFMKEFHKARESYEKGLALDPNHQECIDGLRNVMYKIQSGETDEERARHGMADPEIQAILRDPVMQNVLNDFQTDPTGAQRHLQNPGIMAKIEKLIAAGVLQTK